MNVLRWLQLRRPPDRAAAWVCLVVNQFMTPGLGSIGVGRRIAGSIQLVLAIGGFLLVVMWMGNMLRATWEGALPGEALGVSAWQWRTGIGLLAGGWMYALVTSLQVLWETRNERAPGPPPVPPALPPDD